MKGLVGFSTSAILSLALSSGSVFAQEQDQDQDQAQEQGEHFYQRHPVISAVGAVGAVVGGVFAVKHVRTHGRPTLPKFLKKKPGAPAGTEPAGHTAGPVVVPPAPAAPEQAAPSPSKPLAYGTELPAQAPVLDPAEAGKVIEPVDGEEQGAGDVGGFDPWSAPALNTEIPERQGRTIGLDTNDYIKMDGRVIRHEEIEGVEGLMITSDGHEDILITQHPVSTELLAFRVSKTIHASNRLLPGEVTNFPAKTFDVKKILTWIPAEDVKVLKMDPVPNTGE